MTTIQVFDGHAAQLSFATDATWAREGGAQIEHFNLAQQPGVLAAQPAIKAKLDAEGDAALPLTLVNGELLLSGRYPNRAELGAWAKISGAPALQPSECCSGGRCCG